MSRATRLSCRDVAVELDGARVVDGVSVAIRDREWVCIVGPNGAGKTTLLRALAGLVDAQGEVLVGDRPLDALSPRDRARLVALVPQVPVVPPGMRVLDYVLLGRTAHMSFLGSENRRDVQAAWEALQVLDLLPFADRTVDQLSGGERQRVFVARALAQDAPIVLLDEPTTALDIGHQQDVLELVDGLRAARGLTVVSTMHDLTLAGQYADRIVLMRDGRVTHEGPAADVLTPEVLERAYGAHVTVIDGPDGRVIVPQRRTPRLADLRRSHP